MSYQPWSVSEVIIWLKDIGLGQYGAAFQRLRINGRQLTSLSDEEIGKNGLGMSSEHQALFVEKRTELVVGKYVPGQALPTSPRAQGDFPTRADSLPRASPLRPHVAVAPISKAQSVSMVARAPSPSPSAVRPASPFTASSDSTTPSSPPPESPVNTRISSPTPHRSSFAQPRTVQSLVQNMNQLVAAAAPTTPQRENLQSASSPALSLRGLNRQSPAPPPVSQPQQGSPSAGPTAVDLDRVRREEDARKRLEMNKRAPASPQPQQNTMDLLTELLDDPQSNHDAARKTLEEQQRKEREELEWQMQQEERLQQEEAARLVLLKSLEEAKQREEDERKRLEEERHREEENRRREELEEQRKQAELRRKEAEDLKRKDDLEKRKEEEELRKREEEVRKRLDSLRLRQSQESLKVRETGLDDSDRKGPALKRVLQDSPGGGGAVGLKGSQSMNAVPGSKPVSAQTHATQLISKRGTVGSDSHHSPLLPTGAAPLRPSSSSLSASTPLTFSSNTALSPSADKELTLEEWRQRAIGAEANFAKLKDKVVSLVEKIHHQRETVEKQDIRIAELEEILAQKHEGEQRIKAQIERIIRKNREGNMRHLETKELEAVQMEWNEQTNIRNRKEQELKDEFEKEQLRMKTEREKEAQRKAQLETEQKEMEMREKALQLEKERQQKEREVREREQQEKDLFQQRERERLQKEQLDRLLATEKDQNDKIRSSQSRRGTIEQAHLSPQEDAVISALMDEVFIPEEALVASASAPSLRVRMSSTAGTTQGSANSSPVPSPRPTALPASLTQPSLPKRISSGVKPLPKPNRSSGKPPPPPPPRPEKATSLDVIGPPLQQIPLTPTKTPEKPPFLATPPTPNLSPASPSPLEEARQRSNTQLPASKSLALGVEDIALAKFNFANRKSDNALFFSRAGDLSTMAPRTNLSSEALPIGNDEVKVEATVSTRRVARAASFSLMNREGKSTETLSQMEDARNSLLQMQIKQNQQMIAKVQRKASVVFATPSVDLPPLISPNDVPAFAIEKEVEGIDDLEFHLNIIHDLYQQKYMIERHLNFVCSTRDAKSQNFFVTVLEAKKDGDCYEALINSRRGFEERTLPAEEVDNAKGSTLAKRLQTVIGEKLEWNVYHFPGESLTHDIATIENKHQQKRNSFMLSVVYCKAGQRDPLQMFGNECSKELSRFLKLMGFNESEPDKPVRWNRAYDVIFHCAPFMNAEGHRRLIGNDRTILFFKDEGEPFDPTEAGNLGAMPQSFVVVQPHGLQYRVGFFRRTNLKLFGPYIPKNHLFDPSNVADFVLTKVYNGVIMTMFCPPMNRLFETPRQSTIDDIVAKYPEHKKKTGLKSPITMQNMKSLGGGMSALGQSIKNNAKSAAAATQKKGWW